LLGGAKYVALACVAARFSSSLVAYFSTGTKYDNDPHEKRRAVNRSLGILRSLWRRRIDIAGVVRWGFVRFVGWSVQGGMALAQVLLHWPPIGTALGNAVGQH